jgi:hypothetical protein
MTLPGRDRAVRREIEPDQLRPIPEALGLAAHQHDRFGFVVAAAVTIAKESALHPCKQTRSVHFVLHIKLEN